MKRIPARAFQLTKEEQEIEDSIDEMVPVSPEEHKRLLQAFENTRRMIRRREKNAILHIRINQGDLDDFKILAKRSNIKYQTYIGEVLRQYLEILGGPSYHLRFSRPQSHRRMRVRLSRNGHKK